MDGQNASSNSGQHSGGCTENAQCEAVKGDTVENVENPALESGEQPQVFECPVCLQTASFPVQLPCSHIFCFLCVKGAAHRSKRCAMCRQEIPMDFFNDPKLLCTEEIKEKSKTIFDAGYQWFYEGRNGWWQYDERTSVELEKRYKTGDKVFELLIAGFLYIVDFESMRQYRRNDQHRRRRIRRDLRNIPGVKGIAGLKYNENENVRPSGDGGEASQSGAGPDGSGTNNNHPATSNLIPTIVSDVNSGLGDDAYLTPPAAPNNTPQTPMTPADSNPGSLSNSQEDLSMHLQTLHLNRNHSHDSAGSFPQPDYPHFSYPETDDPDDDMVHHSGQVGELECPGDAANERSVLDYEDEEDEDEDMVDHYYLPEEDTGTNVDQVYSEREQHHIAGMTDTIDRANSDNGENGGQLGNTENQRDSVENTGNSDNTEQSITTENRGQAYGETNENVENSGGSINTGNRGETGRAATRGSGGNSGDTNARRNRENQGSGTRKETYL